MFLCQHPKTRLITRSSDPTNFFTEPPAPIVRGGESVVVCGISRMAQIKSSARQHGIHLFILLRAERGMNQRVPVIVQLLHHYLKILYPQEHKNR